MYASVFRLDLGSSRSSRDRGRSGRSLATVLGAVHGFVAFIALETEDGGVAGLCICVDAAALEVAQQAANAWQRERVGQAEPGMQPLIAGEVIVQCGF